MEVLFLKKKYLFQGARSFNNGLFDFNADFFLKRYVYN